MSFTVEPTTYFLRQAKPLIKKYRSFADDLEQLGTALITNPLLGDGLGKGCYKIRLAITSKGKGKSGGARVITLVRIEGERIVLLSVYDKADRGNLAPGELDVLLAEAGLG